MDIACFSSGIVLDSVCPEAVLYISLFMAAYSLVPRLESVFEFLEVYLVYLLENENFTWFLWA